MATLPNPAPGEVIFHARCEPALQAGDYTLRVRQEMTRGGNRIDQGSRPLPPERVLPISIDAPRFTLDPSQIHAVFPPTNGVGSYVSRLPMIVLRRRTLPWERRLGAGTDAPWMAVLLLEKGEGVTLSPCSVGDVLDGADGAGSPRLALADVPAAARAQPCMGLELPLALFQDIAPMESEVPLLTHARQVSTDDKELLGLDEDGWFSVVVGNRLPEPGKQYQACLVSLEGTRGFLPTEAMCAPLTAADLARPAVADLTLKAEVLANLLVTDDPGVPQARVTDAVRAQVAQTGSAYAWLNTGAPAGAAAPTSSHGTRVAAKAPAWASMSLAVDGGVGNTVQGSGRKVGVKLMAPKVRLFLLAQWSFECRDGGDFESIMQALPRNGGVAMLGLPPSLAQAPEGSGAAVWRAAVDTGHVPLPHLTREGEQTIAWFRGPLTPVGVARESAGPYHHADQARRVDPATGLENLGYAAAFEIGRLLALGDPQFALELMHWRRRSRLALDSTLLARLFGQRFGLIATLPELLDARAMLLMPRLMGGLVTQRLDQLMGAGRLGALRDPTGLLALRTRLPGLDAGLVAEAKGLDGGLARALLGPMALDAGNVVATPGEPGTGSPMNGGLLDTLGFGTAAPAVADLDQLARDPRQHFAPQIEQFELNLQRFGRPL